MEKKTPTNHPHSVGGGILKKEVCEMKQITITRGLYRKPDANEEGTPTSVVDRGSTMGQMGEPDVHPNQLFYRCKPDANKKPPLTRRT